MWSFIQDEILGMHWLNRLLGKLLELVGLDPTSRIGGSIQFFFYDCIKIIVLLGFLILVISYIQSYFPPERTKKILGRFHGIGANCVAALLGTVTPFCSCSSIPLFISFTSAGLATGAETLKEAIKLLWLFRVPWDWAYTAGTVSDWVAKFSFGFYTLMLTSTIIGLVVNTLFKPRTWCSFCPMGTMTQMICKIKAKEKL